MEVLKRWFEKKQSNGPNESTAGFTGPKVARYSGAWATMRKRLEAEPGLRIIDVGYTSPTNINYLTNLGHSVFMADLVHDACTGDWQRGVDEDGKPVYDIDAFI